MTHPYTSSGPGGIVLAVNQFRRQFPAVVSVDTLKKLGIASGSESRVLNVLKFIGILDEEGKKVGNVGTVFSQHDDSKFQEGFSSLVKKAYGELFNLHGDAAWTLSNGQLISFFRSADQTSALVGQRQTITFQALAGLSGKAVIPSARSTTGSKEKTSTTKAAASKISKASKVRTATPPSPAAPAPPAPDSTGVSAPVGQGVKRLPAIHIDVQVHISPDSSPEQIERIFASMAKHLGGYIG